MIQQLFSGMFRASLADGMGGTRPVGTTPPPTAGDDKIDAIRKRVLKGGLRSSAEMDAVISDLRAMEKDQAALNKVGLSVQDVEETIQDLSKMRQAMLSRGPAPAGKVGQADLLFVAYARQSQVALDAIYAQGYADFIDTFGGTDRIRPDDASDATLRLCASVWSVTRDIKNGSLRPQAFGKSNWDQVDARAMYDMANKRLNDDALDYGETVAAMRRDPLWQAAPVQIKPPGKAKQELTFDNISSVWKRSIYSAIAPNEAAESYEALAFAHKVRDGAVSIANGTIEAVAASVDTAYAFYKGDGYAKNASQAAAAIAAAAGVNIFSNFDLTPVSMTQEQVEAQVKAGNIDGYARSPDGKGWLTYSNKSMVEICKEVKHKLETGKLGHLPAATQAKIREMIGPANAPGTTLRDRIESEDSGKWWREVSSQAITVVAVAAASGGVGAFAGGVATGLNAGRVAITATTFVVDSLAFTTLMGMSRGEWKQEDFVYDMATLGVIRVAGKLGRIIVPVKR